MIGPAVKVPMLPVVAKRFVEDAVVENMFVVVALPATRAEVYTLVDVELVVVELPTTNVPVV